eukprot:gnl/TRDRNA2_/TRDRNA2_174853_c0_seq1.p1 gnl/TRDRNA2_/TRDRNA2_174853_c0~~gnl/TRDRNA2_/TRDRNA2_174853_c0_seq1.p1  ORF type:complete len:361 (-),score=54.25 gnl/TRDRNA2_/TRDRNA2_174853_c0_seq1:502-1506(-)
MSPKTIEDLVYPEKRGVDLFKVLLSMYPSAMLEDYYANGIWKDQTLRTDIALMEVHRIEAGAPDPIPLEEVKAPKLPTPEVKAPAVVAKPLLAPGVAQATGATIPPGTPVAAAAELQLLALFIGKWKLDVEKSKALLMKLTSPRRRYVCANFKTTETGEAVFTALEAYVKECETSGIWDTAQTPKPGGTPAAVTPPKPGATPAVPKVVTPAAKAGVVPPAKPGVPVVPPAKPGVVAPAKPGPLGAAWQQAAAKRPASPAPGALAEAAKKFAMGQGATPVAAKGGAKGGAWGADSWGAGDQSWGAGDSWGGDQSWGAGTQSWGAGAGKGAGKGWW